MIDRFTLATRLRAAARKATRTAKAYPKDTQHRHTPELAFHGSPDGVRWFCDCGFSLLGRRGEDWKDDPAALAEMQRYRLKGGQ